MEKYPQIIYKIEDYLAQQITIEFLCRTISQSTGAASQFSKTCRNDVGISITLLTAYHSTPNLTVTVLRGAPVYI